MLVCVANFAGTAKRDYRLGLPRAGRWAEVINTDAGCYGGTGDGNCGTVVADGPPADGQPASATITVGPYATLWLRPA